MESDDAAPRDGSVLCLACGLCCRGVLHHAAVLKESELERASALGLEVFRQGEGWRFGLPCPRLEGTACTVYPERPSTCRVYRCGVLGDYLTHSIDEPTALDRIAAARAMIDEIETMAAGTVPISRLLAMASAGPQAFRDAEGTPVLDGDLLYLKLMALSRFLDRHILAAGEEKILRPGSDMPLDRPAGAA